MKDFLFRNLYSQKALHLKASKGGKLVDCCHHRASLLGVQFLAPELGQRNNSTLEEKGSKEAFCILRPSVHLRIFAHRLPQSPLQCSQTAPSHAPRHFRCVAYLGGREATSTLKRTGVAVCQAVRFDGFGGAGRISRQSPNPLALADRGRGRGRDRVQHRFLVQRGNTASRSSDVGPLLFTLLSGPCKNQKWRDPNRARAGSRHANHRRADAGP